jgi:DNA-binding NarL/FixJ family response regulator
LGAALTVSGTNAQHFGQVVEVGSLAGALLELGAHAEPPRLIMLDLGLPDAEGATALHVIKERCAAAPVLVVSGLDEPRAIDEAFALVARGYVPSDVLLHLVRSLSTVRAGPGTRAYDAHRRSWQRLTENAGRARSSVDVFRDRVPAGRR